MKNISIRKPQGLRKVHAEPGVIMATQNFKRNLLLTLYREGKHSDSCSLFPPFGYPWPFCLLPSQKSADFSLYCNAVGFPEEQNTHTTKNKQQQQQNLEE